MQSDDQSGWKISSPREVALRILAGRFGQSGQFQTTVPLARFQQESAQRASAILEQRGGVLIADSVGLGKTFIALALIENAVAQGCDIVLVIPAALRRMWRRELQKLTGPQVRFTITSHAQLSRGHSPLPVTHGLLVVDEAHGFRNPSTLRYRALRHLCRHSRVVLLTATPVNNALSDLYWQLRLFCGDGAFRDLGIGSLRELLLSEPRPHDVARLKRAIMVKRTRADARAALASAGQAEARRFSFPSTARTHALSYQLPIPVARLEEFLAALSFPAHRFLSGTNTSVDLMRFGLLKRMESSTRAIQVTLERLIRFHEQFLASLQKGVLLRPRDFRSLYTGDDASLQLVFDVVALEPAADDTHGVLVGAATSELTTLRAWLAALRSANDDKLVTLVELLATRSPARTVVFTEFRDTARYLWQNLRSRFAVGMIDGSGAWIGATPTTRRRAVDCFAPLANSAHVHPREAIDVLVATDVLAEGMNLQDADAVVSYDLPWNPVRLIQRAGRVDRIGSKHDVVSVFNFLPDREFDAFLGLARTIRNKLETVRGVVGVERPVLEPDEDFEAVARGLAAGQANLLDLLDGDLESRLRAAVAGAEPVDRTSIPVGRLGGDPPRRVVVGWAWGRDFEARMFELATGKELSGADEVLVRALNETESTFFDPRPFLASACKWIDSDGVAEALKLPRSSAAARLALMIRRGLGELRFDAASDAFERADVLLAKLAGIVSNQLEEDLENVVAGANRLALPALLSALEKVFSQQSDSPLPHCRRTLVALLVAD